MSMALNHNRVMFARLSAFVIWALVAATAVFWGLKLLVRPSAAPPYAMAVGDATTVRGDLTRLLGTGPIETAAAPVNAEASSRFQLLGVVAPKYAAAANSTGVALMAVDGKMPKAYSVGAAIEGNLVLQSVGLRTASIGALSGPASIKLELPALTAAATGNLPPAATESPQPARAPATSPSPTTVTPAATPVVTPPNIPVVPNTAPSATLKPYMPARNAPGTVQGGAQPTIQPQQFQADPAVAPPPPMAPAPAPAVNTTPIVTQ
jgi:general secretion pathway protein C